MVTTVTADQIANQLLSNGRRVEHRRPPGEHHKTIVPSNNQPPTELTKPSSLDELAAGLNLLKAGKATGLDGLLTEMLQHLGNKAKSWLLVKMWKLSHTDVCDCGERQTMSHLMTCGDAPNCTWTDLAFPTLAGVNCAKHWEESM